MRLFHYSEQERDLRISDCSIKPILLVDIISWFKPSNACVIYQISSLILILSNHQPKPANSN